MGFVLGLFFVVLTSLLGVGSCFDIYSTVKYVFKKGNIRPEKSQQSRSEKWLDEIRARKKEEAGQYTVTHEGILTSELGDKQKPSSITAGKRTDKIEYVVKTGKPLSKKTEATEKVESLKASAVSKPKTDVHIDKTIHEHNISIRPSLNKAQEEKRKPITDSRAQPETKVESPKAASTSKAQVSKENDKSISHSLAEPTERKFLPNFKIPYHITEPLKKVPKKLKEKVFPFREVKTTSKVTKDSSSGDKKLHFTKTMKLKEIDPEASKSDLQRTTSLIIDLGPETRSQVEPNLRRQESLLYDSPLPEKAKRKLSVIRV